MTTALSILSIFIIVSVIGFVNLVFTNDTKMQPINMDSYNLITTSDFIKAGVLVNYSFIATIKKEFTFDLYIRVDGKKFIVYDFKFDKYYYCEPDEDINKVIKKK